ncbi:MAG: RNA 2',3'-cyclic phosphodiesterase [Chloroflexi bacterium]|nr:MAG: RNA 2',3'-cyclic phosphodiesterase [Chloroflexota bacterium]
MKTIRAFLAVQPPPEVAQELGRVIQHLSSQVPEKSVRWVKPGQIHITLRFLGETAVSELEAIYQAMDAVVQCRIPIDINLKGLGFFPNARTPRVIWAGLDGNIAELIACKRDLDLALNSLGWELEKRPFRPHFTLGRVKDARKLRGVSMQAEVKELAVRVTAVHFIESVLTRQGPIYTTRHTSCSQTQS